MCIFWRSKILRKFYLLNALHKLVVSTVQWLVSIIYREKQKGKSGLETPRLVPPLTNNDAVEKSLIIFCVPTVYAGDGTKVVPGGNLEREHTAKCHIIYASKPIFSSFVFGRQITLKSWIISFNYPVVSLYLFPELWVAISN